MHATRRVLVAVSRRRVSTVALQEPEAAGQTKSFFLASLPWRGIGDNQEHPSTSKSKKHKAPASSALDGLEDGNEVVASFLSTATKKVRRSPLLTSLLEQMTTSSSSSHDVAKNAGAWLLMRANNVDDAVSVLRRRITESGTAATAALDVDNATVQSVQVDNGIWHNASVATSGPLFVKPDPPATNNTSSLRNEHAIKTEGPLYGK